MTIASNALLICFEFACSALATSAVEGTDFVPNSSFWDDLYNAPGLLHPVPVRGFSRNFHDVNLNLLRSTIQKSFQAGPLSEAANRQALVLGCGDSGLPEELSTDGWQVTAVDQSKVIIDDMAARTRDGAHASIKWIAADATSLASLAKGFHVAIEVALLDTLEAAGDEDGMQRLISETYGLLRADGALLSVSTQPPYFRGKLLHDSLPEHWRVEPVRLPRAKALDTRVAALDPAMSIGNLTLYIASTQLALVVEPLPQAQFSDAVEPDAAATAQQASHESESQNTPGHSGQSLADVDDTSAIADTVDEGASATSLDTVDSHPSQSQELEPVVSTHEAAGVASTAEVDEAATVAPISKDAGEGAPAAVPESTASSAATADSSDAKTDSSQPTGKESATKLADESSAPSLEAQIPSQTAHAAPLEAEAVKEAPAMDSGTSSSSQAASPGLDLDAALAAIDAAVGAVDAAQANL